MNIYIDAVLFIANLTSPRPLRTDIKAVFNFPKINFSIVSTVSPTATLESTVSKLRADNYQLKMKLDEKEEAAKSSEKRGQMKKPAAAKYLKTFFEDIKFDDDEDKKKENESPNSKAKPVLSLPLVKVDSPTDCEGGTQGSRRLGAH